MKNFNCYLTKKWFGLLTFFFVKCVCVSAATLTSRACVTVQIMVLSSGRGFSYTGLSKKDLMHVFEVTPRVKHQYITGCDITATFPLWLTVTLH
jgi:hypothetical protein